MTSLNEAISVDETVGRVPHAADTFCFVAFLREAGCDSIISRSKSTIRPYAHVRGKGRGVGLTGLYRWLASCGVGFPLSGWVVCGVAAFLVVFSAVRLSADAPAVTSDKGPWRLSEALDFPDWLRVTGSFRARYETLDHQFRAGGDGGDQMLATRATIRADWMGPRIALTGEVLDARQALADAGTPINTGHVNTTELLQGHIAYRSGTTDTDGGGLEVQFGRFTMDVGSRRLVARNRFRNTMNAFTGLNGRYRSGDGHTLSAFYTLPINRRPADRESLLDNDARFDKEAFDLQFWGVHGRIDDLVFGGVGEAYLFGLHEHDAANRATRNRSLYTPGLRVSRPAARGRIDFDLETAFQFGESRATTAAADTTDLDHRAHFHHGSIGYTLDAPWSPRVLLQYDFASGDRDPGDGSMNRFDTLYGARRFDHGPTGIFGAFARANISSPGYRFLLQPSATMSLMAGHRLYWLASDTDAWTTSGRGDPGGGSGRFVGHQFEARWRWSVLPGNVRIEVGGAHLVAGEFIGRTSPGGESRDSTFAYCQWTVQF